MKRRHVKAVTFYVDVRCSSCGETERTTTSLEPHKGYIGPDDVVRCACCGDAMLGPCSACGAETAVATAVFED